MSAIAIEVASQLLIGSSVVGKLVPATRSLEIEGLPIGLAHGLKLKRDIGKDQGLSWQDVEFSEKAQVVSVRRQMEAHFRKEFGVGQKPASNGVAPGHVTNGMNGMNGH